MTQSETRICQNCKNQFTIEPEDFQFYEKIKVPPPTWCPECRFQRRLLFWNAVNLYKRQCDLCKKFNISVYPPEAPYTIYCPACWWSDAWDPKDYAQEYDFSQPFLKQLNELWHRVPLTGLSMDLATQKTSPYNHDCGRLKNCYLIFNGDSTEDSAYGYYIDRSQLIFDSCAIAQCQFGYDSMHSFLTNRCIGSRHQLSHSIECLFCRDTQHSQNCLASANLKNKKYWAWNRPLSKEDYQRELAKWDLGSYSSYKELQKKAEEHWKTQIVKSEYNEFAKNCTGPNVFFSKNAKDCVECMYCEDGRFLYRMFGPLNKDCYDISMFGSNLSLSYEGIVVGENSARLLFCNEAGVNLNETEYCKTSIGGAHNFGCVSMKNCKYAILNKQYPKADYFVLRGKIIKHMEEMPYVDARGNIYKYGEFFPPEFSPFPYNTTLAQNFFPLSKEEALAKHYSWRDDSREEYEKTMDARDIPDHIKDTNDNILQEKIACAKCGRAYRIIEMELRFHHNMNVPLPRECPKCRIDEKINIWVKTNRRNERQCSDCGKDMESPYREEESPEIFCRECYVKRIL